MPEERNAWSAPNPDKICYSCQRPYSQPPDVGCYLKELHTGGFSAIEHPRTNSPEDMHPKPEPGDEDLAGAVARQAEAARAAKGAAQRPRKSAQSYSGIAPNVDSGILGVNRISFLREKIPQLQRKLDFLERSSANKEESEHVRLALSDLVAELAQLEGRASPKLNPSRDSPTAKTSRPAGGQAVSPVAPQAVPVSSEGGMTTAHLADSGNRNTHTRIHPSPREARSVALLGLLLAFLAVFLSWFSDGSNLTSLYYHNGSLDFTPVSSPSNQLVTVTYVLYPIALLVAIWAVWNRRPSIWQGLLAAPAVVYLVYQGQEGSGLTAGPILTLVAGLVLTCSFLLGGGRHAESEYRHGGYGREYGRGRPSVRLPRIPRRIGGPLWFIVAMWVLLSIGLYSASISDLNIWYLPSFLGVIAGVWIGLRYYFWVAGIHNRAALLLVTFGSLALAVIISGVLLTPYYYATSSFNQFFGIHYSGSDIGLAASMAAFGTPLVLFVGFSILYAGYKASRTVFVQYG